MNANERAALAIIKRIARAGMLILAEHAQLAMGDDRVNEADIECALRSASACAYQPEDDKADWRVFGGADLDDRSLVCCVNITDEDTLVVVVTVYR
jgi:hypothetical protein